MIPRQSSTLFSCCPLDKKGLAFSIRWQPITVATGLTSLVAAGA